MAKGDDDEFSARPSSRGRMGGRGPLLSVNSQGPFGGAGFDQPGGMKETPAQISATEQELARVNIATVFDPTAGADAEAAPTGGGPRAGPAPVQPSKRPGPPSAWHSTGCRCADSPRALRLSRFLSGIHL